MSNSSKLVYNFSAGPSALPKKVIEIIKTDFPNWNESGILQENSSKYDKVWFCDLKISRFRSFLTNLCWFFDDW